MAKKVIAGCLAVVILGGLAYYSSYLFSAKHAQKESELFWRNLEARDHKIFTPEIPLAEEPEEDIEEDRVFVACFRRNEIGSHRILRR